MNIEALLLSSTTALLEIMLQAVLAGLVLTAVVDSVLRLVPRSNAATRHAVWFATLVCVAVLPIFIGTWRFLTPQDAKPATISAARPTAVQPRVVQAAPPRDVAPPPMVPAPSVRSSSERTARSAPLNIPTPADFPLVVTLMYSAVAALMLLRLSWSLFRVRRLKRWAVPAPEHLQDRLRSWMIAQSSRRWVRLCVSADVRSPIAVGFRGSMILLPDSLLNHLSDEEFDQLVLHEYAHLCRYDDWTNLVQRSVEALFFFHPAVQWLSRRLILERELACDDWVITFTGATKPYARCLTRLVELTSFRRSPVLATGAIFGRRQMSRRIEMLLDKTRNAAIHISRAVFVLVLIVLFIGLTQLSKLPALVAFANGGCFGGNNYTVKTDREKREVHYHGEIHFSPDDKSISFMSANAHLRIRESRGWASRIVDVAPGSAGEPVAEYFVDGNLRPIDGVGQAWIEAAYLRAIREIGLNAEERAQRILKEKGLNALFDEVSAIGGDHGKRRYLEVAGSDLRLDNEQRGRLLRFASRQINSDWEKAEFLKKVADQYTSPELHASLSEYIANIHSDHEQRRILTDLMHNDQLTVSSKLAIDASRSIESDHERMQLLTRVLNTGDIAADDFRKLLRSAADMQSDHERCEVLKKATRDYSDEVRTSFFEAVNAIQSDHERKNVLTKLLERTDLSAATLESVARSASQMNSDNERREVLQKMGKESIDNRSALEIIESARTMPSDHEKASVLVQLAKNNADPAVQKAIRKAANSIGSDSEYRRVMSSMKE